MSLLYQGKDKFAMILPQDFENRMKTLLGDEYDEFLESYNTEINKGVRINPLKCTDRTLFSDMEKISWCEDGYYVKDGRIRGNHPFHAAGAVYFQEPSAMAVAVGLPISEGCRILDLCAAPGGKTTHIAARMGNSGLLVSNEIIPKRAAILSENVERMGLKNTIVTNEAPTRLAQRFEGFFDGIIVDAPCSGEGMFRKEPQAVEEWSENHTLSCAVRQKNILDDAYKMLKCGGYIMYSTCTFSYDENEMVVKLRGLICCQVALARAWRIAAGYFRISIRARGILWRCCGVQRRMNRRQRKRRKPKNLMQNCMTPLNYIVSLRKRHWQQGLTESLYCLVIICICYRRKLILIN